MPIGVAVLANPGRQAFLSGKPLRDDQFSAVARVLHLGVIADLGSRDPDFSRVHQTLHGERGAANRLDAGVNDGVVVHYAALRSVRSISPTRFSNSLPVRGSWTIERYWSSGIFPTKALNSALLSCCQARLAFCSPL